MGRGSGVRGNRHRKREITGNNKSQQRNPNKTTLKNQVLTLPRLKNPPPSNRVRQQNPPQSPAHVLVTLNHPNDQIRPPLNRILKVVPQSPLQLTVLHPCLENSETKIDSDHIFSPHGYLYVHQFGTSNE